METRHREHLDVDHQGICALCLAKGNLMNSHIIPEFLWAPLYGRCHKAMEIIEDSKWVRTYQKGHRERLLCSVCENDFSRKYESGFSRIYRRDFNWDSAKLLGETKFGGQVRLCNGLDNRLIKLFLLSVLWRISLSRKGLTGNRLNLGPHQERMRQFLREGILPDSSVYPISMFRLLLGGLKSQLMVAPFTDNDGKYHHHNITFPGYLFRVSVGSPSLAKPSTDHSKSTGTLTIAELQVESLPMYPALRDRIKGAREPKWVQNEIEREP